jgi:hypothetical protein
MKENLERDEQKNKHVLLAKGKTISLVFLLIVSWGEYIPKDQGNIFIFKINHKIVSILVFKSLVP